MMRASTPDEASRGSEKTAVMPVASVTRVGETGAKPRVIVRHAPPQPAE